MKKTLIVFSAVIFAAICVLNVNLLTKSSSSKASQAISLNKALASIDNNELDPIVICGNCTEPIELSCPDKIDHVDIKTGEIIYVSGGTQNGCISTQDMSSCSVTYCN